MIKKNKKTKDTKYKIPGFTSMWQTQEVYRAVTAPGGQNKVSQSQIHGGVTGKFWELIKFIQLHHVRPHTQSLSTLVGLIEGLEVWTQAWN